MLAIVELKEGRNTTEEELMEFCAKALPRYKQPKRIIFDKVPRNPTGKIEKPALRKNTAAKKTLIELQLEE